MCHGAYISTGNQETLACEYIDLELLTKSHGLQYTAKTYTGKELVDAYNKFRIETGTGFIDMIISPVNKIVDEIPLNPIEIKKKFMKAIST